MPQAPSRRDPSSIILASPALRVLEAAGRTTKLSRADAAKANKSGVTTADDYLRALAHLGFLNKTRSGRRVHYSLTKPGRALVARRPG